jgi:MFS family permease
MLDGMDVTLYALVIPAVESEFHLSSGQAGMLASITLVTSAVGGVLFGLLADRAGRRQALMLSVVVYSVFTAACGLSRSVVELAVFRAAVGLGMGGEWATGAALVAETWSSEHRGKALGLMQSGFAVGYALAAAVAALVLPQWGWRTVFFVGLLPATLALWIRHDVPESSAWLEERLHPSRSSGAGVPAVVPVQARGSGSDDSRSRPGSPPGALQTGSTTRSYRGMVLLTLLMNSAALFAWWGLFTWIPAYLALPRTSGGRGLTVAASSLWIAIMQVGMWVGYVSFGFVSDIIGGKRTYISYLAIATLLVPLYARAGSAGGLLVLGPLMGLFGTGHFTGLSIITTELFPVRFRAAAMGLTYNFGRILSAAAPWAVGTMAGRWGFAVAFWLSGAAFLIAALLALGLPDDSPRNSART